VLESLFPFYYAILTSFKSGTSLFEVNYWPTMCRGTTARRSLKAAASPGTFLTP
jgi:ABC-type glycerol-3-phosphate transport system permease component